MRYIIIFFVSDEYTFDCEAYEIVEGTRDDAVAKANEIRARPQTVLDDPDNPIRIFELGPEVT